jgi:hypothetical protein
VIPFSVRSLTTRPGQLDRGLGAEVVFVVTTVVELELDVVFEPELFVVVVVVVCPPAYNAIKTAMPRMTANADPPPPPPPPLSAMTHPSAELLLV